MRLLDRYIGRTVAASTGVVMAVLLAMYFFSSFVGELDYVGQGKYTFILAVQYSLLLLPRQLYELFPLTALLGAILGLGALASSSELTVIRAAGVSVRRVILSVFKVGLLMVLLVIVVGELVSPPLEKFARIERAKALAANISVNTEDGFWVREGNTFINIRRLLPGGVASNISLYRFDDAHRLESLIWARKGRYSEKGWELERVRISHISEEGVRIERRKRLPWKTTLTPEVIDIVAMPPENLSIWDLYGYVKYLWENGLDARRYELALWMRAMAPFATAGMVLLAVPFVFGSLRSVGIGQRITVGGLLGIGFYLFNGVFSRIGIVYDIPPLLSAVLPTFLLYIFWMVLMRRVV